MRSPTRHFRLSLILAASVIVLALIAISGISLEAQRTPRSPDTSRAAVPHLSPCDRPNIAPQKATSASSCQRSSMSSALAVDGDPGTRWASDFVADAWMAIDLGAIATVECVVLQWENAFGEAYTVDVSNDGVNWTPVFQETAGDGATDAIPLDPPVSARHVRMYGTHRALPQFGYSLWEMEVRGSGGKDPAPTPVPTPQPGTNIALGKPAYASSYDQAKWAPRKAVDGNHGQSYDSRWASTWSETGWISLDLGAVATIDRVLLFWEDAYATGFQIQVSEDAETWTTVYDTATNQFDTCQAEKLNIIPFSPPVTGRYVRMLGCERCVLDGGLRFGYSLYEVEVYGTGDDPGVVPEPTPGPLKGDWRLIWHDEFDGSGSVGPNGLDEDNWTIETGVCVNSEQQGYTTDVSNVRVEQGVLILEAHDTVPGSQVCPGCNGFRFTSGRIMSKEKREVKYGRFEARMRLPVGEGAWPAFWLLGANIDDDEPACSDCGHCGKIGWPLCGEIDIMENIGYADWVSCSLHGPGYSGAGNVGAITSGAWSVADWHLYSVEWDPLQIEWSMDGVPFFSVSRETLEATRGEWVFDHPFFVVLNLALGGTYPYGWNHQEQGGGACYGLPKGTIDLLPLHVEVDWVRVYAPRLSTYLPCVAREGR